ncbi:prophage LambdaSa2 HNH endonuclease family protein [Cryptobacterium sp. CAG:338]|jgi:hypothetical protein|nr:prophage LambdaSa2 HNH endonuclease family protein [Cryptobacterium sp. CAG:338]
MAKWAPVSGYEGIYEISDDGRIRSLDRWHTGKDGRRVPYKGRMIAPGIGVNGYKVVSLWKNGKGKSVYIHRLVAETFIKNPENKKTVNHKDGNRTNNNVSNLEWATYSENNLHEYRVLGKKGTGRKLTDMQVVFIRNSKESPRVLAAMFGVSDSVICNVKNKKIYREVGGAV